MKSHFAIIEQLNQLTEKEFKNVPSVSLTTQYDDDNYYSLNQFGQITNLFLKSIDLNGFDQVLDIIKELSTIVILVIKNSEIGDSIGNLKNLEELLIINSIISNVSIISNIISLRKLEIQSCKIKDPIDLGSLVNLTVLNLSENQISDIGFVSKLEKLKFFWASNNNISDISSLRNLKNLKHLGLAGNKNIKDYNPLNDLLQLTELNLVKNNLDDISFLANLSVLNHLILVDNSISDIEALQKLTNLEMLDLRNNKISRLPKWFVDLNWERSDEYTQGFQFDGNPIVEPPIEIVKQGLKAMKIWFIDEKEYINEVKVLLVGHGEVGKTTLVKCLTGVKPNAKEKPTHHINISSHNIDCFGKNIKLNFWDFGGQEVMHSTHQFFLSKRSVYLLLLDGRRDEDPEYWLKHIESFGADSPVLIVLNKIDTNPSFEVDRRFLMNKYPFIFGFYKTVCLGNIQGIDELNSGLNDALDKVEILSSPWPKTWVKVKNVLESISDDFISQMRYDQLCEENDIYENDAKEILAEYLNDLGIIVHFKDLRLTDLHILQPRWASRAAYKIINSSKVAKNNGKLKVEWLKEIMKQEDENDFSYKEYTFPFVLDLMQKFELCYAINEKSYLLPELIDVQQPELPKHKGPVLTFHLKYEGILPKSILTKFTVRMNEDIYNELTWRTGVVLSVSIFNSLAIIIADTKDKKITIAVSGRNRREHFAFIRKTFRSLNDDFEKLIVKELIPLPGFEENTVEYDELIGHEEAGMKEYFSGKLRKSFMVKDLLDGIETESVRKRDFFWDVFLCHSSIDKPKLRKIINDFKVRKISYWLDEEQINPGDFPIDKITEGLEKSKFIAPFISKNQLKSGWSRNEYQAILTKILNGKSDQRITTLILDDTPDDDVPLFLSTLRYERYNKPEQYNRLLELFSQNIQ